MVFRNALTLLIILLGINTYAQSADESIKNILKIQEKAWNQGDIRGFMDYYWNSEDLIFISPTGPRFGWQETLDRYIAAYPDKESMGKLSFKINRITKRSKKVYTVLGDYHLERVDKENMNGIFQLIFQKIKGDWFIVADCTY